MTTTDAALGLWQAFYKYHLADFLTRIGIFCSAIVLINSSFTDWNRRPTD